jgi:signal transduction histidine kinase
MEIPSDLPAAIADAVKIEQVLTNLAVNAVNYTPPGGVVTMSAGTGQMEERPAVWLRVSDTGCGIATEDLPHIFERFFRGQASQNNETSGTGLGLAISKEIVERHQGKIEVESKVGHGTAFTLWLLAAN